MILFLIYTTTIVCLFLLRIVFALTMKKSQTGDTHWHFLRYKYLKRLPWYKIDYTIEELIGSPKYGYPILLHKILGWFPTNNFSALAFALNLVLDITFLCCAQFFYCVFNETPFWSLEGFSFLLVLGTSAIYFPSTARFHAFGNSRILGLLFATACVGFFVMAQIDSVPALLIPAVVFYLLTLYSSQFGFQALYLLFPILAVFHFDIYTLLFALLPIFLLIVPSARIIIFQQWDANRWRAQISKDSVFMNLRNKPVHFIQKWKRGELKTMDLLHFLFISYTPSIVLVSAPLSILFLIHTVENLFWKGEYSIPLLTAIGISYFIIVLLTSTKWLSTLGEAERYLEFAMPFLVTSCFIAYHSSPELIILFLGLNFIGIIVTFIYKNLGAYGYFLKSVRNENSEDVSLIDFLNTQPAGNILTVPIRMWMSLARTVIKHRFYFYKSGSHNSFIKSLDYLDPLNSSIPVNLTVLCRELDIHFIIVDIRKHGTWLDKVQQDLVELKGKKIYEGNNHVIIHLNQP